MSDFQNLYKYKLLFFEKSNVAVGLGLALREVDIFVILNI